MIMQIRNKLVMEEQLILSCECGEDLYWHLDEEGTIHVDSCENCYEYAREAGEESGFESGYELGHSEGVDSVDVDAIREESYDAGYSDGYDSGHTEGYDEGFDAADGRKTE